MRAYFFLFLCSFLILCTAITIAVSPRPKPFPFDRVVATTDLAQRQIRPGLNVDSLPLVRIDYGGFRPASDVGNGNGGENEGSSILGRRQACLTRGAYLGPENDEIDCAEYCDVAADEVRYTFVTNDHVSRLIRSRTRTKPGSYCMPTLAATCNRNTSLVVYTIAGWTCLPMTEAFAGEGGNRIVACDGTLLDRALGVIYRDHIPPNLMFGDVYSDRTSDGQYRFVCPPSAKDTIGNAYLASPLDRLQVMRNWCVAEIPHASSGTPDTVTATCLCTKPFHTDPRTGQCVTCFPRYDLQTHAFSVQQRPCYSFRDDFEAFARAAEKLNDNDDEAGRPTLFPCGWNVVGGSPSEYTLPRCIEYLAGIHQPPILSPRTLVTIDELHR